MSTKRKAETSVGGSSKKTQPATIVNTKRLRVLKNESAGSGPVIYWMSRDQRMDDNWALLYAVEQANISGSPVAVAFNLVPEFLGAGARMFGFMLRGLMELEPKLATKNISFFLLKGDPAVTLPQLVQDSGASLLVTDYSPLRIGKMWKKQVSEKVSIRMVEVDAHNVVPVWVASDKRETAARTIRPKIHKNLPEFMREFPPLPQVTAPWTLPLPPPCHWEEVLQETLTRGAAVPEVTWCIPGETAALAALSGPSGFLSPQRLSQYADKRNDPTIPQALSNLSPYLHFGQLAPQRAALEAAKLRGKYREAVDGFLEELVVRRELSDNFCEYEPNYDNLEGAAGWARETLTVHAGDKREHVYTRQQLEDCKTHDELWNAAQTELNVRGKLHGFMRMYWCKKILEWSASPREALEAGIYLNDKYSLDGRDPNGYVGVMWSVAGVHDQGWAERAVFGKIRYMNYAGCKRKFNIAAYVAYANRLQREHRAAQQAGTAAAATTAAGITKSAVAGAASSSRSGSQLKAKK